jgi:DNA-binding NtrC family response regulator
MEILLIEKDALLRDQVKVGLQQFDDFHVTVGSGYRGVSELRGQQFDCVFVGVDPQDADALAMLEHLRSCDARVELFVMTSPRQAKAMASHRTRLNIHSFLTTPIEPKTFFEFLGRFRDRRAESGGDEAQGAAPRGGKRRRVERRQSAPVQV